MAYVTTLLPAGENAHLSAASGFTFCEPPVHALAYSSVKSFSYLWICFKAFDKLV